MKHKLYTRLLSLALAVGLVIGMLPSAAAVDTVGAAIEPRLNENQFTVQYVDAQGNQIANTDTKTLSGEKDVSNYAKAIEGYDYSYAKVGNTIVTGVRYVRVWGSSRLQYYDPDAGWLESNWKNWNNATPLTLVYSQGLSTVETVDSASKGVNISLFNYQQESINSATNSIFKFGGGSDGGYAWNTWTGGAGVYQGIVGNQLTTVNGTKVPSFNVNVGQNNLSYLFTKNQYATAYTGLNHLFLKSTYDSTGYYEYDAGENFATIADNLSDKNFKVYNQPYKPNDTAAATPKFLPFNDLSYNADTLNASADYLFGMKVDFTFYQPKDGIAQFTTSDGQTKSDEMKFEFTGDDDVWVFIDDVLVLDMGGIHDAMTGSINFATGDVYVNKVKNNDNRSQTKTLYEIMRAAKGQDWVNKNMTQNEDREWIFKDYTNHTFNYYYLERGAGGSNCRIRFNLQAIPEGVIQVGKEITQAVEPGFSDAKFKMEVEVANETNGVYGDFAPYNGTYDIKSLKDNSIVQAGLTTKDGTFELQNGQYAELKSGIKATTKYKVTELAVYGYESDYEFDLSETSMVDQEGGSVDEELGHSKEILVGEIPRIVVQNKFKYNDPENPKYMFTVQKKMAKGQSTTDSFTFKITNSRGEPYTGDYYVRKIGEGLPSESQKSPNGEITIQAGQEIVILGVASGSTFVVKEINLDSNSYDTPKYEKDGNCEGQAVDGGYSVTIKGTTAETSVATVMVTNTLKSGSLTIEKVISGNLSQSDFDELKESLTFEVKGDKYTNTFTLDDFTIKPADNAINGTYSITIDNIPVGSYTVTESGYEVADYDWKKVETTVDVTVTSGTTPVKASFTNNYTRQTGSLIITKTVEGLENDSDTLGILKNQLKFTVTGPNGYNVTINFSDDKWKQAGNTYSYTIDNLPTGEYTVAESEYDLTKYGYNWTGTKSPVKGTVNNDDSVTVPFTNTYTPANINLTITKQIQGDPYGDGRDMFSFRITCIDCADDTNVGKVWYVHINGNDSKTITLPVGKYKVEELSNMHYKFVSVVPEPEEIPIDTRVRGKLEWGYDLTEDETITFTNEPVTSNIPSDGGGVENHFDKYEDGKIVWKPEEYGDDGEIQPKPTPEPSGE